MTPKYKAKQLFEKIYFKIQSDELGKCYESAKQCALIAVDEILEDIEDLESYDYKPKFFYWSQVKQELEAL